MDRAKIVNYYLEKINDKDFNIFSVRQELEKNNIDEQEIRIIIRLVDNEVQRRVRQKATNDKSKELIWFGGIITAIGLFVTIGSFTGLIGTGESFVIAYGPVGSGLAILFYGLARRR